MRAEARTPGGGVFVREAIVRIVGQPEAPFRYLGWKQGMRKPAAPPAADR